MVEIRCRWIQDPEIGPFHIPGCWSAVVGGEECCTCEGPDEDDDLGLRLARLEARLAKLEMAASDA